MKRYFATLCLVFICLQGVFANPDEDTASFTLDSAFMESLRALDSSKRLNYQTGTITLDNGLATLNVPAGFKYLDAAQTEFVLTKLWNNPPGGDYLGMLLKENTDFMDSASWVFIIQYDEIGYVSDDDAEDIDYDELLTTLKKESEESNQERKSLGYDGMNLVGWASAPYYDKDKKILHWAKEFQVDETDVNTLNYNIRILGRKGVLVLNAIAGMPQLPEVKENINTLTASVTFEKGYKYEEFDSKIDNVAAWTLGGLVAGKVLAKVGFFAVILKFGKFIVLGLIALGAGIAKFFRGGKDKPADNTPTTTA